MSLHRAHAKPEWETISPDKHTFWQRMAHRTHGIVTPGNILTIIGLKLALIGLVSILEGQYWQGLLLLAAGRLLDIADGLAAEKTGTKSPLGETLDASVDKIITGLTIVVLFAAGTTAWPVLLLLLAPHLLITAIVALATAWRKRLHPSRIGKVSMALTWVALLSLVAVQALGHTTESVYTFLTYGLIGLSSLLGIYSFAGYARELWIKSEPL